MTAQPKVVSPAGTLPDAPPTRSDRSVLSRLRRNPLALAGGIGTATFLVLGVVGIAMQLLPGLEDLYAGQDLLHPFLPVGSPGHPLGTDNFGRDILARLIAGLGTSLFVGVAVTAISLSVGLLLGIIAGYEGRYSANLIDATIDVALAFPVLLLAVVVAGAIGPGLVPVILAVALTNWAGLARIVRGEVKGLRRREFMDAARSLGHPTHRIVRRHLVPNLVPTLLVMTAYFMAIAVVVEAGFSFLALGAQPPTPSLGQMLAEGRNFLSISTWPSISAGICLALVVLSLNTLGDGLRDVLDPRLAGT
jgi:peptide/nickel transport system permease protein